MKSFLCSHKGLLKLLQQSLEGWWTGGHRQHTKSQISGGVCASVPRSTIITQGRQAITESRGRYQVHNFSKPVTLKQKHRNWRISAQNVKNMLKFTPITVSLPGNAVLRHNSVLRSSASLVIHECQMFSGPQIFRSQKCHLFTWNHNVRNTFISQIITLPIGSGTRFPPDQ